uniref:Uncharacterized protein n=1 Tax=Timema tahoe TaxID=61484 RepID=A0A7R9P219_9NEOP|nr:unnamed protein product [Timema tahoe]
MTSFSSWTAPRTSLNSEPTRSLGFPSLSAKRGLPRKVYLFTST